MWSLLTYTWTKFSNNLFLCVYVDEIFGNIDEIGCGVDELDLNRGPTASVALHTIGEIGTGAGTWN